MQCYIANKYEKKQTEAIHSAYQLPDTYGALSMPVYHSVAYEFKNAAGLIYRIIYDMAKKQFGETAGAMLTIELESCSACFNFINRLKLIRRATNLFDNRSLAIHPASTIFGNFTQQQRDSMDILDTTVRIFVGLEAVEDLFEDIRQALEQE